MSVSSALPSCVECGSPGADRVLCELRSGKRTARTLCGECIELQPKFLGYRREVLGGFGEGAAQLERRCRRCEDVEYYCLCPGPFTPDQSAGEKST